MDPRYTVLNFSRSTPVVLLLAARTGYIALSFFWFFDMLDLLNMILHIDQFLGEWVAQYGAWIYLVLFLIIFGETGLVVLPFLPGDSLLFIAGAFGASGLLDPVLLSVLLIVAAVLGNTVNYAVGRYIGPRVFTKNYRFLDRQALIKTHVFYEKHGGKTIILSRFLPIFRTFAPFVAGVASMNIVRFQLFNVTGALLWVVSLVTLGYFFGNVPIIKEHLNTIVLVGIGAAAVPVVLGGLWKLVKKNSHAS
jgi:membrane-associated protein